MGRLLRGGESVVTVTGRGVWCVCVCEDGRAVSLLPGCPRVPDVTPFNGAIMAVPMTPLGLHPAPYVNH